MTCNQCGAQHSETATFCSACGAKLGAAGGASVVPPKKKMSGCLLAILIAGGVLAVSIPVVAIIAAIAIPNLLNAIDRGKQKRTLADMRSLSTAIEEYSIDYDFYPTTGDIDELGDLLADYFGEDAPITDGWGHPLRVESGPEGYRLVSKGKDGLADGCEGGPRKNFADDICLVNAQFTQWPEALVR